MIRKIWLGICGRAASVAVVSLLTVAMFELSGFAQSAPGGTVLKPVSPPAFLVAPSLSLGYAPTSIAAGALTSSGKTDLVTADYNAGKITVFTAMGHGSFAPGISLAAGAQPTSLVIADVDGDGRADVLLANPSEGVISVFSGNGDGTLGARKTFAIGFAPSFVAVGDFTGNGNQDIAVAGAAGKSLAILQNDGSGNLNRPVNYALGSTPAALISADFNHDGHLDLAIANTSGTVTVFLGKGNGQFSAQPDVNAAAGALTSIAVSDFNRDGNLDLVVTSASQDQAAVLLGKGDGKFAPAVSLAVGNSPIAVRVADVDGDGTPDLIVINKGSNTFSVLNGVGDGTFKSAAHFVVGNSPLGAAAADFYGNGHVDLATINQLGQTMSFPAGNSDGTFAAGRAYVAGAQPVAVASGDLTGSGKSDLVVANYCGSDATCGGGGSAAVLLAGPGGVYQLASTYTMGAGSVAIHLVDVNGDGKLDMVALNRADKSVSVRLGSGDGTFGKLATIPLSSAPIALTAADFNNDGKIDLAVLGDCGSASCSQPGAVEFLMGAGDGNFHSVATHAAGFSPVAIAAGKTSPGGNTDVVVANRCGIDASCKSGGTATLLLGDGTGAFKPASDLALGNNPASIALADLHGTGILDLVVSRSSDNTVAVLPGIGKGTFGAAVPYAVGHAPGTLVIADFNGDGQPDVAVANTADSSVSVLFGKAGGTLQPAFAVPVAGSPSSLAALGSSTGRASLATPSGSITAPSSASNVTVVPNLVYHPYAGVTANTTTLTATPNTTTVNAAAPVTLHVTVTGGAGTPTGTVDITSNGSPATVCSGLTLDGTGAASCSPTTLQVSVTTLTATYNGDATYATSTGTAGITVNAATPIITLTPSPASPSGVNTQVTFTATLTGAPLTPVTPTGTMTFKVDGTTVAACTATVTSAGVATCPVSDLALGVRTVTATYSGDPNFVVAAPGSASYTIAKASPTVVTTTPSNPTALNASVTFTASLGSVPFTPTAPGGTVAFSLDGTAIGTCAAQSLNSSQQATCAIQNMTAGSHSITSNYTGDANFNNATAADLPHTVSALTPTVTVTTGSPTSTALNASITFTATLSGVAFTPIAPAGTVSFSFGGVAITNCTAQVLNGSQQATCTTSSLAAGNHNVTATFTPSDSNFSAATSPGLAHTVTTLTPTVTVTTGGGSSTALNTSITFTATLSGVAFTPVAPAGTVSFSSNGTAIAGCTAQALNGSQQATCTTSSLTAGADTITATLAADSNFNTATSAGLPHTVTKLSPTVTVTASTGTTSAVNAPVTFTATLSGVAFTPVAPGATVNFQVNGITIATCGAQAVNPSQQATCTTSALTATNPTDAITAVYAGDSNFNTATSAALTYSVTALTPTLTITSSQNPSPVGTSVTFTAALGGVAFTPTVPNGTVTWKINGITSSDCPAGAVNASQRATCTTSALVSPADTIAATYSGDNNFTVSAPTTFTQTVGKSGTTVNLTALPTSTSVNVPVLFTATVPGPTSGAPFPTGSVTFMQGANTLCGAPVVLSTPTPPLNAGNQPKAACTVPFSVANSYPVVANYSGDANFSAGSSNQVTVTIGADATTTSITYSGTPSVNAPLVFSPQVVPNDTGTAKPQGNVALIVTGSPAPTFGCTGGVVAVTNGTAPSCSITFGAAGNYTVKATFTPSDTNFSTSTSSTTSLTIATGTAGVLVSSGGPSNVNATVTFTASFSQAISGTQPTGTVTYTDTFNGTPSALCTKALSGGVMPSCDFAFVVAGTHSVTAAYSGDGNFKAATSDPFTQPISQTGTTTAVTSSLAAGSSVNQSINFAATVSPAIPGTAVPTGKVIFSYTAPGGGSATPICGTGVTVAKSGSNATASCSSALPATGTGYTISATYGGDTNFLVGTAGTVSQNVSATSTTTSLPQPASAAVNQPVTYTATVTPTFSGSTAPTGKVSFADTSTTPNTDLCPGGVALTAAGNAYAASCTASFDTVRTGDSIVATYTSGDSNFSGSAAPPVTQVIGKEATTLKVTSSLPGGSFATQAVTFTAVLAPGFAVPNGGPAPSGNIVFALTNDPADACIVTQNSPYSATCTLPAISSTVQAGKITVTATYAGDGNFISSTGNVDQIVGNFSLAFSAPTGGSISLTQFTGATTTQDNTNDPFFKQIVSVLVTPSGGYGRQIGFICQVADSGGHSVTDPSCKVNPANPVAAPNLTVDVRLSASAQALVGDYTVNLVALDNALTTLQQVTTNPLTVKVVGVTGTLTLAQTGTGTASAVFNTAGATSTSLTAFACSQIIPAPKAGKITCTGPSGSQPVTGVATTVPITLALSVGSTAAISSGGLSAASFIGLPVLALLGWVGCRRSRRRNFFRIVGLLLLAIGLSYVTACGGGSFTRPTPPVNQGVTPGTYLIQVTATGDDHKTYIAVIPLVVNGN